MYTDKEIEEELVTCSLLNKHFAERCTAHGFSRIASTGDNSLRRLIWIIIVIVAVGGFLYHISFLTSNYFSYPIMTATEEVHAEELHFPAITVCNLNIMRKSSFDDYLKDVAAKSGFPITTTTERPYGSLKTKTKDLFSPTTKGYSYDDDTEVCYKTVEEFLKTSRTMDLSDMWMNFIATKEHLVKFGHKANDLVVQCTYNARNCFDETHSILRVDPYPSPRYGLCQTIRLANDSMRKIRKTGPTLGLRLTLNIERSEYLDIISPEFGARLLIHPLGTAPTLERGGIILSPGSKSYISIRMYCQTLCREAALLRTCDCLDELSTNGRASCDPCNVTQARCRTRYLRSYTSSTGGQQCKTLCLPECVEVRYDLTTSQSEWPNFRQQSWSIKRWPLLNKRLQDAGIRWQEVLNATDDHVFAEELHSFRNNFLRVHIYIQEMNYLSVRDLPAYPLPQLFADLGGCLGLYIGVSAITIFEFFEHLLALLHHIAHKFMGREKRASTPSAARDWDSGVSVSSPQVEKPKSWSFLVRNKEYPLLAEPPRSLFRTEYSGRRGQVAPVRKSFYLGYTVPEQPERDGGFFGKRFHAYNSQQTL
ncbi:hypothetical protein HPB47_004269 [Ixodes persulcatus]|uniref:Uncharacterized protein n=1 Tax=Ixodes persulcatus TaxID=34615 RepID=A0AC60PGC0_IXOPE|nr:hypothetical protein HPB47_004269 [Ixodes persulcatus]